MTIRAAFRSSRTSPARAAALGAALLVSACAEAGPAASGDPFADVALGEPRQAAPAPSLTRASAAEVAGAGGWAERGTRLLESGRNDAAITAFRRAIAEEGPSLRVLLGLGAAHRARGLQGEARRIFARAARAWPDSPAARNNYGAVLYDLGLYAAAESQFRAAADLLARRGVSPGPEILRNLALAVRARSGRPEETPPSAMPEPA